MSDKPNKIETEKNRIQDEFEQIQSENKTFDEKTFDITQHLARAEDLPDLGEIEIYDYDADLTVSSQQSMDVLESLVDLFLSDVPQLKEHPYIKNKMKEDALVYAETIFLQKMTRKVFLTQMRGIDNGDNSSRMYEVLNQTIGQIRENAKFSSTQKTELEKFYKELRGNLGYSEIENPDIDKSPIGKEESHEDGEIIDNRKLNDLIKNAMMKKEDDKKDDKKK
jgi:hypothetical protein